MRPPDDFTEAFRDARAARVELGASLSLLSDRLAQTRTAVAAGDRALASRALNATEQELDAARWFGCALYDAHRELGRCLTSPKAAA